MAWTYATLKEAIQGWLVNESTDLTDFIDELIGLGEVKLVKDLDLEIFDSEEDISFVSGTATLDKPTGCISIRALWYMAGTSRQYLRERSREYLNDYAPDRTVTGTPTYWCEESATTIRVAKTPASSVTGKALIIKRPEGLSGSNTTTWLGTNAPDALLYACLLETSKYEMADERIALWQTSYDDALDRTKVDLRAVLRKDYATVTGTSKAEGER